MRDVLNFLHIKKRTSILLDDKFNTVRDLLVSKPVIFVISFDSRCNSLRSIKFLRFSMVDIMFKSKIKHLTLS